MGCPAPKVANNGEGSALLKTPELAGDIVRTCKKTLESAGGDTKLTVKMRIGWDEKTIIGEDFAKRMEASRRGYADRARQDTRGKILRADKF